jgi:hypothetical protein
MRVVNNHRQPLPLESGVVLAAAGTEGSVREIEELSANDRRLVDRGLILVTEAQPNDPKRQAALDAGQKERS